MISILVFRIGSLGDTLVAVPALRAVRAHYDPARITLLCDRHPRRRYVLGSDLLRGRGLVDAFLHYPVDPSPTGRLLQPLRMLRLLSTLRAGRFDAVVYLAPSNRPPSSVARDRRFFRAAGIPTLVGFEGFPNFPAERPPGGYAAVPQEADLLLARLMADGLVVPAPGTADAGLPTTPEERDEFDRWNDTLRADGGRRWIGVGTGCKQPVNRWPLDRYVELVRTLVAREDVWPIVFGGPEDVDDANRLVAACGRGRVAAGALSFGAAREAMRRCAIFVGNDTGTIHMAAAAGTRCVGVYSSRNLPGQWHPYGSGHTVLRTPIACEYCQLFTCVERKMECLLAIGVEDVVAACERALACPPLPNPASGH